MENSISIDILQSNSIQIKKQKINNLMEITKKYEILGIPGQIQIGNYIYIYKYQSKEDKNLFIY